MHIFLYTQLHLQPCDVTAYLDKSCCLPCLCAYYVQLSQQSVHVALHPGETVTEVLSVTPLAAGWLRIKGAAWCVGDAVEAQLEWQPKGRRRKHAKGPK